MGTVPVDRDLGPLQGIANEITDGKMRIKRKIRSGKGKAAGYDCLEPMLFLIERAQMFSQSL